MNNIYWPVYKNLEKEFIDLMFNIHIDDNQLDVYSVKTSDLILRSVIDIESIVKELYIQNGGTTTGNIKYDEDGIRLLNKLWSLDKKVVFISSPNCFQTNKSLYPFKKNEKRSGSEKLTYSWNSAYQNLKHNRALSLKYGSLKHLFESMAALFVLNIYYKNEVFDLGKDSQAISFPVGLGSDIFSIKLHKYQTYNSDGIYQNHKYINECIYLTKLTDSSMQEHIKTSKNWLKEINTLIWQHPKVIDYLTKKGTPPQIGEIVDVLGSNDYSNIIARKPPSITPKDIEAVLNKVISN